MFTVEFDFALVHVPTEAIIDDITAALQDTLRERFGTDITITPTILTED